MTKKILCFAVFIFIGITSKAQQEKNTNYLFNNYEDAEVKFKTGSNLKVKLNYNLVTEEMVYLQGSTPLAIAETYNIDTVYVKGLKFIPNDKEFFQLIEFKKGQLLIRRTTRVASPSVNTGLGESQTTAQTSSTALKLENKIYSFDPPGYSYTPKNILYLKINNKLVLLNNAKALDLLYPSKSKEIKAYISANRIDFNNVDEVTKLLNDFSK